MSGFSFRSGNSEDGSPCFTDRRFSIQADGDELIVDCQVFFQETNLIVGVFKFLECSGGKNPSLFSYMSEFVAHARGQKGRSIECVSPQNISETSFDECIR